MERNSLQEIYTRHTSPDPGWGDKGTTHSYIDYYAEVLEPYRDTAKRVLEIGIAYGHSHNMWVEYFTKASIVGNDISDWFRHPNKPEGAYLDPRIYRIHGDSTDHAIWFDEGPFDVIIDDGSHMVEDQIATFKNLWPLLNSGGIYIIEDVKLDALQTIADLDKSSCVYQFGKQYDDNIVEFRK